MRSSHVAQPVDAVIVGAGLSGLMLAGHLADSGWHDRRVVIVDDGSRRVSDCSWAFWTQDLGWLGSAVTHSWDRLWVHTPTASQLLSIAPHRYHVIEGSRLLDVVRHRVAERPGFECVDGHVVACEEYASGATVQLENGDIRARWVFDSRPAPPSDGSPFLQFLGCEIDTDVDAFDPSAATFMDFRRAPDGRVSFAYVLPLAPRRALVEIADYRWTGAIDLVGDLDRYLRETLQLDAWTVRRTEAGALPLERPARRRAQGRVVPIGARAGMLKASTGFALDRIRRHSAAITRSLVNRAHPHDVPIARRRHAWLDHVFLQVLHTHPELVDPVFTRLFEQNPAPAVLGFLDEDTTITQEVRLVSTLPRTPFLKAGLSQAFGASTRSAVRPPP